MRCITIGALEHANIKSDFIDDGCVSVSPHENNPILLAQQFIAWCESEKVDIFMPVNSIPMINAIPHAPKQIRVLTRCADSTDEGYRRATYEHQFIAHICASTPRHVIDLPQYGVPDNKVSLIPHGLDLQDFTKLHKQTQNPLQLIFVGRLHEQKGIFMLPAIIRLVENYGVSYQLTIVGSGPHDSLLRQKLAAVTSTPVLFLGSVPRDQIPELLSDADILLFLSKHEGFGFVLIEAMAAGCVPISSKLPGVTDFIIDNETTGILCPVNNALCFANAIKSLFENRARLSTMAAASVTAVHERFSQDRMADDFARVLNNIVRMPTTVIEPRSWNSFKEASLATKNWHDVIPRSAKREMRRLLHYLRRY